MAAHPFELALLAATGRTARPAATGPWAGLAKRLLTARRRILDGERCPPAARHRAEVLLAARPPRARWAPLVFDSWTYLAPAVRGSRTKRMLEYRADGVVLYMQIQTERSDALKLHFATDRPGAEFHVHLGAGSPTPLVVEADRHGVGSVELELGAQPELVCVVEHGREVFRAASPASRRSRLSQSFAQTFRKLVRARGPARARLAHTLVSRKAAWDVWLPLLNDVHVRMPEQEGPLARALLESAKQERDALATARFRLIEARALHRTGSPAEAASAFLVAARALRSAGDAEQATKADVLRVDALAHAGRGNAALRLAERLAGELTGRAHAPWRQVLRINRANALRLAGRAEEAVTAYEAAARAFRRRGDLHTSAIARTNAGVALMDTGRPDIARRRFEQARRDFEDAGHTDMALDARQNAAWAAVRCGDVGDAVRALTSIAAEQAQRGLHRRAGVCRMDLAEALLTAGDHQEALRHALEAERTFASTKAPAERCEALLLAAAASWPLRPADGTRRLKAARRAARAAARPSLEARCDLLEQDARMRAGEQPDGRRVNSVIRRAQALRNKGLEAEAVLLLAQAAIAAGRIARAATLFADRRLATPGRPWLRCAAETGRAACEARRGDPAAALRRLRRVAAFLDKVRAGLPGAWLRTTFALSRLDPYLTRVDLLLERGRPADCREAEAVLDALAARRFVEGEPPAMHRPLAHLRRRLEAIYDQLARGGSARRGSTVPLDALERQARRLEQEVSKAWRAAERESHRAQAVSIARPRTARLSRDTAAIHLWTRDDRLRGLVRRGDEVPAPVDLGSLRELSEALDRMQFNGERLLHFGGRVSPEPLLDDLTALSERLLAPLRPETFPENVRLLPDPSCPDVPWEVLPLDGVAFCARHRIVRVPSLRVRRRRGRRGRGEAVVTVGERDLPEIGREVASMGPGVRRLAGVEATRDELREALIAHRVVHVAGHGYDAPEAPGLAGIRLRDGWFTAVDVPRRVGTDLVVLAACRTGVGGAAPAVAWGGLARALLRAGARWVLWTGDEVDDSTTADLMTRFHAARRAGSPDRAFGTAVAEVWRDHGHPAGLLAFRLSGIAS